MTRAALFCPPYVGGTYATAVRLRRALLEMDYDVRCIGVEEDGGPGRLLSRILEPGVEMWTVGPRRADATGLMIERLVREHYRLVITMPLENVLTTNLTRYLPTSIGSIVTVPMMSHSVYARTRRVAKYADRIIGVSDRVATDLIQRYGISPAKVCSIFNGVDMEEFCGPPRRAPQPGPFRVLYVGRISDLDKGVLLLPPIMDRVRQRTNDIILDVVGDGGDEARLAAQVRAAGLQQMLRLLGPRPLKDIPALLQDYHCVVMPSRMEACGWSLLEGMAAGCVPVVHDIWGSMGTIVENGVSGFTVPVGDIQRFADRLVQLSQDPDLLCRMAQAAQTRVAQRFSSRQMVVQYAAVIQEVLTTPSTRHAPESLARYSVPSELMRSWRSYLPRSVKTLARGWMIRRGLPA